MLVCILSNLLRDQSSHPGLHLFETINAEVAAPMTALEPTLSHMETARAIGDSIIRHTPLPHFQGFSEAKQSGLNDPVLFQDQLEVCFTFMDVGAYRLPSDVPAERGKWVTQTDRLSGHGHDLAIKVIATHLGTHRAFFAPTPVTVYCIMTQRDIMPTSEVPGTDWLRLFVRNEATQSPACAATRDALNGITRKPSETITAATRRLINAFRVQNMDRRRPHATKTMFFGRYIPEDELKNLIHRLCVMVAPTRANASVIGLS